MSRFVELDPNVCQETEPEGQEYRYCVFEQSSNDCTVQKVLHKANMTANEINSSSGDSAVDSVINITQRGLCQLQKQDHFCKEILSLLQTFQLQIGDPYCTENELLMRNIIDKKHFQTIVLP